MHPPPASVNTQQSTPPFAVAITTATTLVASSPEDRAHALRQQALTEISCPSVSMEDPVRHPQYYDAEGTDSVIFLVEKRQLFRVFRPSLLRHSETLKIMFSMPPGEGKRPNGETDDDPVVLPSSVVTVERFELFLAWLYQDREVPANLEEASTLLHLADYLDVPHLLKRMSAYVLALPPDSLPPAKRIYLHRRYHLSDEQWLRDAFSSILEGPFSKLTVTDLALLGIPTVHRLIPIFAKLEKHRTTLAVKPPPATHENDCKDYDKCEVSWLTFWATRISPLLSSETSPASGLKITRTLSTWAVSPWAAGMNYSCLWATANGVSALTNIVTADQSFISTAVSDLVDTHDW